MKSLLLTLLLLALVLCSPAASALEEVPPLLDREIFFDDPDIVGGSLSPDGRYVSFLRSYEGMRNVWVKGIDENFSDTYPVTGLTSQPVRGYLWSREGRFLLYYTDQGGDENFALHLVDIQRASPQHIPSAEPLTPERGVRAAVYHRSYNKPGELYIGLNDRDPSWHDLYRLCIDTRTLELVHENRERYTWWVFDWNDRLRAAVRASEDGSESIIRMSDGEVCYQWGVQDTAAPIGFTPDASGLYMKSNADPSFDKQKLLRLDIETGEVEVLEKDPRDRVDLEGVMFSRATRDIIATIYIDHRREYQFRDDEFKAHHEYISSQLGDMEIVYSSSTEDQRFWFVSAFSDTQPASVYIYDVQMRELTYQYTPLSEVPSQHMSPMIPISYPSSDGLEIPAYLTLPKGFSQRRLPLIVLPHGGPWVRDYWGFSAYPQFFANRGYAVLQPNFRISTGYGKEFFQAGFGQWGDLMQDDLTWGVKYLVDQGIVDPERVGIFGGSYGGYAALAGLAFTPELYAAGVSLVGPSNIITLLESIPPYWESAREMFRIRVGDVTTEAGRKQLKRQSPLFAADEIRSPLMVVQGENDPRVLKAESDQIVEALYRRGYPVTYLNAPDEGHGFVRPVNRMAFIAELERFFASHLGGRYQQEMPEPVARRLEEIRVDVPSLFDSGLPVTD